MNISKRFKNTFCLTEATMIQLLFWASNVKEHYFRAYDPDGCDELEEDNPKELIKICRQIRTSINIEIASRQEARATRKHHYFKASKERFITPGKPVDHFRSIRISNANPANDWIY
jgi:hypothetical protein